MSSTAGPPRTALRERWRERSLRSVWLRPGDWAHPAADTLAGIVDKLPATSPQALLAAEDLGRARGELGAGIGETLDDLACLFAEAGVEGVPTPVVRALCEGWADAQAGAVATGGALDPQTGLPTRQYLGVRLAEVYQRAEENGLEAARTQALAALDVAAGEVPPLLRAARQAAAGAALRDAFGPGQPMATLGGGVFVVLVDLDGQLQTRLDGLRAQIRRHSEPLELRAVTRRPVRVWLEHLPPSHEEAVLRLRRLSREGR